MINIFYKKKNLTLLNNPFLLFHLRKFQTLKRFSKIFLIHPHITVTPNLLTPTPSPIVTHSIAQDHNYNKHELVLSDDASLQITVLMPKYL